MDYLVLGNFVLDKRAQSPEAIAQAQAAEFAPD
jgi:hypothetical protein